VELWTAPDATSGIELVRRHQPGLVLLDLHLPDLPGDEVLRQLRTDPPATVPVVAVCSADASPAQIDALTRMGADHYIVKPLDIQAFLAIVDDAAARRQATESADAH
jgi:DNA-binding response OmpR family regulator